MRCSGAREWKFDHGERSFTFEMNSQSELERWTEAMATTKKGIVAASAVKPVTKQKLEQGRAEADSGQALQPDRADERLEGSPALSPALGGTPAENWKMEAVRTLSRLATSTEPALPSFLSDPAYLMQWLTVFTSSAKAIEDFKKALDHRRELGLDAQALHDNRFRKVRALMPGMKIMTTRSKNRIVYYERYDEGLVMRLKADGDKRDGVLMIHAYWDAVLDETFSKNRAPPVTLLDVSHLQFAHLDFARFRAGIHGKLSYGWVNGCKFYLCGTSWSLRACWNMVKPWLTPDLVESIQFLAPSDMPKLLDDLSPEEIPLWCLEMSPALQKDPRLSRASRAEGVRFCEPLVRAAPAARAC
jgi:hypothetical protein